MKSGAMLFGLMCFNLMMTGLVSADLRSMPDEQATRAWPVTPPLPAPNGLRPCCAFGHDLRTQALGVVIPFYRIDNVVEADGLDRHCYNDNPLNTVVSLVGLSPERAGILYSRRGGFLDIAHIRDTADMTLYIFSQLWPQMGQDFHLQLEDELVRREVVVAAFAAPTDEAERYTLAAYLAARLAFQVAEWHEIAQWYGLESVQGFPEEISAFSPEDLYSNLLGARLATTLILQGQAKSVAMFDVAMQRELPLALHQLGAVSADETRAQFTWLDGKWWDSHRTVPEKFLVLKRNYQITDTRLPTRLDENPEASYPLNLRHQLGEYDLTALGELRLWPGESMKRLPLPVTYYHGEDLQKLASLAQAQDEIQVVQQATAGK